MLIIDKKKLKKKLIALGLLRLNRIELLTHKNFVCQIQPYLSKQEIQQCLNFLLTFYTKFNCTFVVNVFPLSEKHLPALAYEVGYSGLIEKNPLWNVLKILFPQHFSLLPESIYLKQNQSIYLKLNKLLS